MFTPIRLAALALLAASLCALTSVPAGASSPQALNRCPIGNPHAYGYTKLTSLAVSGGISCSLGQYIAGKRADRHTWACTSVLLDKHLSYYDRRVLCTMKVKDTVKPRVRWTYRQNT